MSEVLGLGVVALVGGGAVDGSNQEVVLERESHIWVHMLLGRLPGVLFLH